MNLIFVANIIQKILSYSSYFPIVKNITYKHKIYDFIFVCIANSSSVRQCIVSQKQHTESSTEIFLCTEIFSGMNIIRRRMGFILS